MKEKEFKEQYLGEFPRQEPVAICVNSFSSAADAAFAKGLMRRDIRYVSQREHIMGLTADWKKSPRAPLMLAIHYTLWDEAKIRGIVPWE